MEGKYQSHPWWRESQEPLGCHARTALMGVSKESVKGLVPTDSPSAEHQRSGLPTFLPTLRKLRLHLSHAGGYAAGRRRVSPGKAEAPSGASWPLGLSGELPVQARGSFCSTEFRVSEGWVVVTLGGKWGLGGDRKRFSGALVVFRIFICECWLTL